MQAQDCDKKQLTKSTQEVQPASSREFTASTKAAERLTCPVSCAMVIVYDKKGVHCPASSLLLLLHQCSVVQARTSAIRPAFGAQDFTFYNTTVPCGSMRCPRRAGAMKFGRADFYKSTLKKFVETFLWKLNFVCVESSFCSEWHGASLNSNFI